MASKHEPDINVFISTFPGLGLAPTLTLHLPRSSTTWDLLCALSARLPPVTDRLLLTTTTNKLVRTTAVPLSSLLSTHSDTFVSLRLSVPLCGGKGGFGSQLRAAGGRMSSRKKRTQGEANGSNRNLDGRRLRTVNEAKALAEYLAVKPEMERREKEERRRRWEQLVEASERREEEIRTSGNGAKGTSRGKVDELWAEQKEEAESKTREAVLAALHKGEIKNALGDVVEDDGERSGEAKGSAEASTSDGEEQGTAKPVSSGSRSFFGWDEDDVDSSDEEDEHTAGAAPVAVAEQTYKGKGKGRA